jgi:hypothetical protein
VAIVVETWRTNESGVQVPVREVLVPRSRPARFAATTVRHVFRRMGSLCRECYGYPDDPRHNLPAGAQQVLDKMYETPYRWDRRDTE